MWRRTVVFGCAAFALINLSYAQSTPERHESREHHERQTRDEHRERGPGGHERHMESRHQERPIHSTPAPYRRNVKISHDDLQKNRDGHESMRPASKRHHVEYAKASHRMQGHRQLPRVAPELARRPGASGGRHAGQAGMHGRAAHRFQAPMHRPGNHDLHRHPASIGSQHRHQARLQHGGHAKQSRSNHGMHSRTGLSMHARGKHGIKSRGGQGVQGPAHRMSPHSAHRKVGGRGQHAVHQHGDQMSFQRHGVNGPRQPDKSVQPRVGHRGGHPLAMHNQRAFMAHASMSPRGPVKHDLRPHNPSRPVNAHRPVSHRPKMHESMSRRPDPKRPESFRPEGGKAEAREPHSRPGSQDAPAVKERPNRGPQAGGAERHRQGDEGANADHANQHPEPAGPRADRSDRRGPGMSENANSPMEHRQRRPDARPDNPSHKADRPESSRDETRSVERHRPDMRAADERRGDQKRGDQERDQRPREDKTTE